ncbi:MAG: cyclic nucleotide-binding domain-containing protein [Treponema sp.]|nr:cyclic nucleotide-binding domain-containing protein [Treponema sp.]
MSGQAFDILTFHKDSFVTVEGRNTADSFYIIRQGTVRISRKIGLRGVSEETLVAGDFFGIVSAFASQKHIEDAVALSDVTLIAVKVSEYADLIQDNSLVAVKILMQLSKRLRLFDAALIKVTANGEKAKPKDGDHLLLFKTAEFFMAHKRLTDAFHSYAQYLKYGPPGKDMQTAEARLAELTEKVKRPPLEHPKGETNRTYPKGQMLFAEGEPGEELFIIQSGSVRISKIIGENDILLGVLKPGDILGEMALLENKPRSASAVAAEDCTAMAVTKSNFDLLIKNQPQLVTKITTLLAGRIWFSYRQLETCTMINPLGRIYSGLLAQLEKAYVHLDSSAGYTFNITWEELINSLGLSEKEGFILMGSLQKDKNIEVKKNGRILLESIEELVKKTDYYRKLDIVAKSRDS